MGVPNLQNMQQHNDVLEKLKMQVGLMDPEFSLQTLRNLSTPPNTSFTLPQSSSVSSNGTSGQVAQNLSAAPTMSQNSFSFTPPSAPHTKDGNYFFVLIRGFATKFYWNSPQLFSIGSVANFVFVLFSVKVIQNPTHRHPAKHRIRRSTTMAGASKNNSNKSDRLVMIAAFFSSFIYRHSSPRTIEILSLTIKSVRHSGKLIVRLCLVPSHQWAPR